MARIDGEGPNIENLILVALMVVGVPLILCAVATLLAALQGANARRQLPTGRHWVATAVGGLIGSLTLATAIVAGLVAAKSLAIIGNSTSFILVILVSAVLGMLGAYHTARWVATRLDRYRCRACRVRFRSLWPATFCPRCDEERDRNEVGRELAEFPAKLQRMTGRGRANLWGGNIIARRRLCSHLSGIAI